MSSRWPGRNLTLDQCNVMFSQSSALCQDKSCCPHMQGVLCLPHNIQSTFNLNLQDVYSVLEPVDEFHIRPCDICNINDFDTENQLFLCDGCNGCFHMQCSRLDWVPQADWLCKTCITNGLFLIDEVLDKQTRNGTVEYLIHWVSQGSDDEELESWQQYADLPSGPHACAKEKVTAYNTAQHAVSKQ